MFLGKFFNCHSECKFASNYVIVELECFRHKTFIHNTHPATLQPFSVTTTKRLQQTCNPIQTLGYITTKKDHKHMSDTHIEDPDKWIEDANSACPATTATRHLDVFNEMVGSEPEHSAEGKPANYVPTFEHMTLLAIGSDSEVEIDDKIHWVKAKFCDRSEARLFRQVLKACTTFNFKHRVLPWEGEDKDVIEFWG